MSIEVRPLPAPTRAEREEAERTQRELASEPERVQKAAENWRTGLAGVLALALATTAFGSRDDVAALAPGWPWLVAALAVSSIAAAVLGLDRLLRAAHGTPRWEARSSAVPADLADRADRRLATRNLSLGRMSAYAALALFVGALLVQRLAPSPPAAAPSLYIVEDGGRTTCGTVEESGNGVVSVKAGEVVRQVPLASVEAVTPVTECP